jgi:methylglyoxal/glyoxal reductase
MSIPLIGFGTYRLHDNTYNSVIEAIKSGYTHIDTAPLYRNESIVGDAIKNSGVCREKLFITTKISRNELKSNDIRKSIQRSLIDLKVDYIDLLLLHEPIDFLNNWEILSEYFKTEGKGIIKNIGVSNYKVEHLEHILNNEDGVKIIKPYCNQIELNPFIHRNDISDYCNKNKIKIVAHSPLAKGEKLNNKTLLYLESKYSISPAKLMLQWNTENNNIIIPRSKNVKHIKDNLVNYNLANLDKDDIDLLNNLDEQYSTHPKYL